MKTKSESEKSCAPRIIGLDSHPDTFTAAVVLGNIPKESRIEKIFNKVPMKHLAQWAEKNTRPEDTIVLEASGNSFYIARTLRALPRNVLVLESCQMGKLKDAHANNDKISAFRIAKAYLAGTAKEVWVPDLATQERRDIFLAYKKAVKRTTQMQNRIDSYLSDHGVRDLAPRALKPEDAQLVWSSAPWTPVQRQILESYFRELEHSIEHRGKWESIMAQTVLGDPKLLSLVRQIGVRHVSAFALGAIIGDIKRFKSPKALVNYLKLCPSFDDSGEGEWTGNIGRRGRKDLRALIIQGAHAVIKTDHPIAKWARKLLARKGEYNLCVAAVARKMVVAIWYLMKGQWTTLEEVDDLLSRKIGKIISKVDRAQFNRAQRKQFKGEVLERLKTSRVYNLDPKKAYHPPEKNPVPA